ncbi:MAG TPA: hypothetical protein VMI52_09035 [Acetobacteraceae bacterium]|nr:hypothetical protein [Acetobacteraceae bacterium]
MATVLVVVRPFGSHAVGDVISDTQDVSTVLAGEHKHDVVRAPAAAALAEARKEG